MADDRQTLPSPAMPPADAGLAPSGRYAEVSFRKPLVRHRQSIRWAGLGALLIVAALLSVASVLFATTYWPAERLDDCAPMKRLEKEP